MNSLGLTEAQPENNVQRIVLEMLGVTLSKRRAGPRGAAAGWNEALGLPRPWDQQWSLRIQQVLALRDRPARVRRPLRRARTWSRRKTAELADAADAELQWVLDGGGAFAMIDADEGAARAEQRRAGAPHRVGRHHGRRRERVHRDRAVAAGRVARRRGAHPRASTRRPSASRSQRSTRGAPARDADAVASALDTVRDVARGTDENLMPADDRAGPRGRHRRRVGRRAARGVRRVPRADRRRRRRDAAPAEAMLAVRGTGAGRAAASSAARSGSSWASPGSTATPTAPSRSRSRHATPGWRSSTRASGSRRSRSRRRRATRTSTWSACRSSRARTSRSCPRRCGCCGRTASTRRWSSAGSSPTPTSPSSSPRASPGSTPRRTTASATSWPTSPTW